MAGSPRPSVVTEGGDLACPHTGRRSLTGLAPPGSTTVKLTVAGSRVVPVTLVPGAAAYTGCLDPDSNSVNHPCASTVVVTAGAARLTVGGTPVLLDSDTVTSSNDLPGTTFPVTVRPAQSTLTAS